MAVFSCFSRYVNDDDANLVTDLGCGQCNARRLSERVEHILNNVNDFLLAGGDLTGRRLQDGVWIDKDGLDHRSEMMLLNRMQREVYSEDGLQCFQCLLERRHVMTDRKLELKKHDIDWT